VRYILVTYTNVAELIRIDRQKEISDHDLANKFYILQFFFLSIQFNSFFYILQFYIVETNVIPFSIPNLETFSSYTMYSVQKLRE